MFGFLGDLRKSKEDRRQEALTAYLDGALAPKERLRFERRLAEDEALRIDLEQQRLIKQNLGQLPRLRSPRNFTLNPAVYGRPQRQPVLQLYPALRTATVLVGVFFVIALTAEIITSVSSGSGMLAAAPNAEPAVDGVSRAVEAETVLESVEAEEAVVGKAELPLLAEEAPMEAAAAESIVEETVEDSTQSSAAGESQGEGGPLSPEEPPPVLGEAAADMAATASEPTMPKATAAVPMPSPTLSPEFGLEEDGFARATPTDTGSPTPGSGALSQAQPTPPVFGTAVAQTQEKQPLVGVGEAFSLTLSPLRILIVALGLGLIVFAMAALVARRRS